MNEEKLAKNTFKMVNEEGLEIDCEVLFTFSSEETKKDYIVYTDNTLDKDGNVKVYASIYDPTFENKDLIPIETEKEWQVVESILSSIQEKLDEKEDK